MPRFTEEELSDIGVFRRLNREFLRSVSVEDAKWSRDLIGYSEKHRNSLIEAIKQTADESPRSEVDVFDYGGVAILAGDEEISCRYKIRYIPERGCSLDYEAVGDSSNSERLLVIEMC